LAIGGRGKTKLRAISAGAVNLSSYSIIIGGFADKVDTTLRRTVSARATCKMLRSRSIRIRACLQTCQKYRA